MKKAFFASIAVLFIVGLFALPVSADDRRYPGEIQGRNQVFLSQRVAPVVTLRPLLANDVFGVLPRRPAMGDKRS